MDNKDKIKELRKRLGFSQAKFAEKWGIPKRTIEDWEAGKREVKGYIVSMMYKIVEFEKEAENK
nr:MAG TPA: Helix-turn-helix XRE-family like protein [Caudoviricetes sp.]